MKANLKLWSVAGFTVLCWLAFCLNFEAVSAVFGIIAVSIACLDYDKGKKMESVKSFKQERREAA